MKKQHIARLHSHSDGSVDITFQEVVSWNAIERQDVSGARLNSTDDLSGYSDWMKDGSLIKMQFESTYSGLQLRFEPWGVDFVANVRNHSTLHINTGTVDLIKELQYYQKFENKLYKELDKVGIYSIGKSTPTKVLIALTFKLLNVVGGTAVPYKQTMGDGTGFAFEYFHGDASKLDKVLNYITKWADV